MNRKQPAVLYPRTYILKDGHRAQVWWYYITNEQGKRLRFSLKTGSKSEARLLLAERLRSGTLHPQKTTPATFGGFAKDFWDWDSCPLLAQKRLRGDRLSRHWSAQNRGYLTRYLIPAFSQTPLAEISMVVIERFLLGLRETEGLSAKTINSILGCLRAILGEAVRQGFLLQDPAAEVRPLRYVPNERGILSLQELRKLFADGGIWDHPLYLAMNLLACATGARLGEIRALKVGKVLADRLVIDSVVRRFDGYVEGDTKTGTKGCRIVPLPSAAARALGPLIVGKPPEAFVFSLDGANPIAGNTATRALHKALAAIGIGLEEQARRRLGFHSWRHLYNSLMRGQVSESDLRSVTGHASAAMTAHYTHAIPERIEQFAKVQEGIFCQLLPALPMECDRVV